MAAAYDLVVRPRTTLLRSTALSIAFSAAPLAVALMWVSLPPRLWALVASVVVVLALATTVVLVRLGTAFVGIGPERFDLRRVMSPNVTLDRSDVDRIVLATTYGGSVDRTTRELVALSTSGTVLFRMRSDLWDETTIARVANVFGVQITELRKPMPIRAFARRFPTGRAWHEGRRGLVAVGTIAAVFVLGVLIAETTGLLVG
ncbi:hypothetical protein ASF23_10705 [Curtobacterium sp. Leaf261]|nr:hypothetical protein ASF23_10705 [Curtobacterium sp. Leaf261]